MLREDCYDAAPDTPWKRSLPLYYAFFTHPTGRLCAIFYRQSSTDPRGPVFSIEMVDGDPVVTEHDSAYDAFHALQRLAWTCLSSQPSFAISASRFEQLGVSPERLEQELYLDAEAVALA